MTDISHIDDEKEKENTWVKTINYTPIKRYIPIGNHELII